MSSFLPLSGSTHVVVFRKHPKMHSSVSCMLRNDLRFHYASTMLLPRASGFRSASAVGSGISAHETLKEPLPSEHKIPRHVAFIMDGNRRWADEKGLPARDGHNAGLKKLREMLPMCYGLGVRVVTVFAFSSENWSRSTEEVNYLMALFEEFVAGFLGDPDMQDKVRFSVIGNISKLPESLKRQLKVTELATQGNEGAQFVMALNYGGRQEIIEATKQIATKVMEGELSVDEIDKEVFEKELQTKCMKFPCPDLIIRTSGEKRLSNFLLWQMAYTELQFVDKFFPDLGVTDIVESMLSFQGRKRRFGGN